VIKTQHHPAGLGSKKCVVEIDFFFLEHKDVHAIASGIVLCGVIL
jgi:hypothetical protein